MVDGSKLVLYQTGVVSLVRRHHALHDQGPVLQAHLLMRYRKVEFGLADMKELVLEGNNEKN